MADAKRWPTADLTPVHLGGGGEDSTTYILGHGMLRVADAIPQIGVGGSR
jgi:hypothetical protein